jgi:hypothetical protein
MVRPPKTLLDLRCIEAGIRVTCLTCGDTALFDREALIHDRTHHQLSLGWAALQRDLRCWKGRCKDEETRVVAVPFSQNAEELMN